MGRRGAPDPGADLGERPRVETEGVCPRPAGGRARAVLLLVCGMPLGLRTTPGQAVLVLHGGELAVPEDLAGILVNAQDDATVESRGVGAFE